MLLNGGYGHADFRFYPAFPFHRRLRSPDASARLGHALDDGAFSYPPYNIEQTGENSYRIVMAVAGFGEGDLSITQQGNSLLISGKQEKPAEEKKYLYRGIAGRAFERRFELADHIKVTGASLVNGVLSVELVREVPEAMKPRSIKIGSGAGARCSRTRRPNRQQLSTAIRRQRPEGESSPAFSFPPCPQVSDESQQRVDHRIRRLAHHHMAGAGQQTRSRRSGMRGGERLGLARRRHAVVGAQQQQASGSAITRRRCATAS